MPWTAPPRRRASRSTTITTQTPREYLFHLEHHGVKLGLETISYLLNSAGRPQDHYPTVHVAGTNGKGSVVAMLDAVLRAAGYTVGRFTSPHLIDVCERFQVNGEPISEGELDEQILSFRRIAEERASWPPTFFELNTAMAFSWFEQRRVDCALIEVGLGGRFDSTNVIIPVVSAITTIAYDHMRYLGDTLEQIAFEKAGIIKEGRPVVLGETKPGPREVILGRAAELAAPVHLLDRDFRYRVDGSLSEPRFTFESDALQLGPTPLGLLGRYQGENAAVAVALAMGLVAQFPRIDAHAIAAGLATARWPCRLEKVLDTPPVIIDVAHNTAGAQKLAAEMTEACVTLMAVSNDKDAAGMIEALEPVTDTFILSQFSGERALPVDVLCAAAGSCPHRRTANLAEAIDLGLARATSTRPLLITGSIFTAGEARRILVEHHGARPLRF